MESLKLLKIRPLVYLSMLALAFFAGSWSTDSSLPVPRLPGLMGQVKSDLAEGEYVFLPNRRSIWVVNRTNGRMASYEFLSNELDTVQRSRVAQIDIAAFPPQDTVVEVSDRYMSNVLWICNARTGDVQMWTLSRDGEIRKHGPIATSADLMARVRQ